MAGKRVKKVEDAGMYDSVQEDIDLPIPESITKKYPNLKWRYRYRKYYDYHLKTYIEDWNLTCMARLGTRHGFIGKPDTQVLDLSADACALTILAEVKREVGQ